MGSFSSSAFFTDAFSIIAFDIGAPTPQPTIIIDTHDGDRYYRKRTKERAKLRAIIEAAMNGPAVIPPVLAEMVAAIEPYRKEAKIDLALVRKDVMEHLEKLHAKYALQLEDDEEETLMVLH